MTNDSGTERQVRHQGGPTVVVNGPEDEILDWWSIDWPKVEDEVRRLRQRIFTASKAGDLRKVRNLQKLMLRSRANALVSVRRVTEQNAGRKTAGVDGKVAVRARQGHVGRPGTSPRRVRDRPARQAGVHPQSERTAAPARDSGDFGSCAAGTGEERAGTGVGGTVRTEIVGFRPGRGCHDAIEATFNLARGANPGRQWVLDADLAKAFDRIDHDRLLGLLGTFPARKQIEQWLKAGVVEEGRFAPTEEGTLQGGVISPVLLNIALHGMEEAAGVRYRPTGTHAGELRADSPAVIRYADL
jgi:RNA-directed DNA polymerase